MSQRRTLILVAAIAIGALASFLVWNYVNNIQDEAYSEAERVPVYLIKEQVAKGTAGDDAAVFITKEDIPRKFLPSNAITSLGDISGKVAVNDLVTNQVVVTDMFVPASDPRAQQTFSTKLKQIGNKDMVTATIQVDVTQGAAGLILPGDYVNIMVLKVKDVAVNENGEANPEDTEDSDLLFERGARYLYQKVQVLAIDKSTVPDAGTAAADDAAAAADPAAAGAGNTGLITFLVPVKGAQYLASLESGQIYLSLVARDYEPVPQTPLDPNALLPAEDTSILTPYGPEGAEKSD